MKLYPYQEEYLKDLPKNIIMAADVGLGKTIMAMEHARRHGVTRLVVVAPASKVRTGDWQREIVSFFKGRHFVPWGTPATEDALQLTYEVVSYEMFTKRAKEFLDENITLIVDESHMACNATTKRGKAIIAASRLAHQWIMLSATPLPNGWRSGETYSIMTNLCRNKTEFVNRFVITDRSRGFPLILGYREEGVLEDWWAAIAKPLERTGSMKLESKSIAITPEMTPKEWKVYQKAVKTNIITVDGEDVMLDSPGARLMALRQVPNETRISALDSVLESTDEHIVVFYNFNSERDAILALLNKSYKSRKVYEQSGHRSELPPRDKWETMKPSVTLVQYQSGSMAIELTYAAITVYLSPCSSWANYEQSLGRTRRNGQKKMTLFYHIAVEGSLDRHMWGILKKKKDFSTQLFEKVMLTYNTNS